MFVLEEFEFQPALPLRGVTGDITKIDWKKAVFQPALPLRGVTSMSLLAHTLCLFQPALPLRGVTPVAGFVFFSVRDFNPHSPCGE